jgi:hypothetical protein
LKQIEQNLLQPNITTDARVLFGMLISWHRAYCQNFGASNMKVVYNGLLGGWYIVRGAHQTPISGRFDTKEAALAHLRRTRPMYHC